MELTPVIFMPGFALGYMYINKPLPRKILESNQSHFDLIMVY